MPEVHDVMPDALDAPAGTQITVQVIRAIYGDGVEDAGARAEALSAAVRRMVEISGGFETRVRDVDKAQLRVYWQIGCEITRQATGLSNRSPARRMLIEEISSQLGWAVDRTYRAIQVGDTYTEELMTMAEARNFTFSATYVIIGAIKDLTERRTILRQAIEEGWSAKEARQRLGTLREEDEEPATADPEAADEQETAAETQLPPAKLFAKILSKTQSLTSTIDGSMIALAEVPRLEGDEREVAYRVLHDLADSGRELSDILNLLRAAINDIEPIATEAEDDA